jgi:MYXO-CTERM domain-containing protein
VRLWKWLAAIAAAYVLLVLVLPESAGRWVSYGAAAALIAVGALAYRRQRQAART